MKHVWPLLKKPGEHVDPGFANFGVRVSPKLKSVWWARYSEGTGKARKEASTTFGLVQFETARADGVHILDLFQAHAAAREWIAEQKDPAYAARRLREREAARARPLTLGDGFEEYLLLRQTRRQLPLADETKKAYRMTFDTHLAIAANWPLIGTGPREWLNLFAAIKQKSLSRANESMAIVSGIYTHYETLELPGLERNPIRNVRRTHNFGKPVPRETSAQAVDLPRLLEGILKCHRTQSRDALLVTLLTGMRNGAVCRLRYDEIDFKTGTLQVKKQATGWKGWHGRFPLGRQVMDIIRERQEAQAKKNVASPWVFPARHGKKEHMTTTRDALSLACERQGIPHLGPHDLRRTFSSMCGWLYPGDVGLSGALLAHRWALPESPETSITLSYQKKGLEQLRHASEEVASAILEIGGIDEMSPGTRALLVKWNIDPEKMGFIDMTDYADAEDEEEAVAA